MEDQDRPAVDAQVQRLSQHADDWPGSDFFRRRRDRVVAKLGSGQEPHRFRTIWLADRVRSSSDAVFDGMGGVYLSLCVRSEHQGEAQIGAVGRTGWSRTLANRGVGFRGIRRGIDEILCNLFRLRHPAAVSAVDLLWLDNSLVWRASRICPSELPHLRARKATSWRERGGAGRTGAARHDADRAELLFSEAGVDSRGVGSAFAGSA